MPPQTRGRRRVEATAVAAADPLPLPSLPDEIWEQVMSHFTENRWVGACIHAWQGMALLHSWRRLHQRLLSVGALHALSIRLPAARPATPMQLLAFPTAPQRLLWICSGVQAL